MLKSSTELNRGLRPKPKLAGLGLIAQPERVSRLLFTTRNPTLDRSVLEPEPKTNARERSGANGRGGRGVRGGRGGGRGGFAAFLAMLVLWYPPLSPPLFISKHDACKQYVV